MPKYMIRNDVTHRVWVANAGEAKLYAMGGPFDIAYSVFREGECVHCLCVEQVI